MIAFNHTTLNFAVENNLLKEYADFLFLKYLYVNSCFFNYTQQSLSEKSGFSRTKIRRLMKIFSEQKWTRIHSTSLVFNNLNKGYRKYFAPCNNRDTKSIRTALQFEYLKSIERKCKFIAKKKRDLTKPDNLHSYKKALRYERKHGLPGAANPSFDISLKSLAKHFCTSLSSVANMIKEFKKKAILQTIKNTKVIFRGVTQKMFEAIQATNRYYCFYSKGCVIEVRPSTLLINPQHQESIYKKRT